MQYTEIIDAENYLKDLVANFRKKNNNRKILKIKVPYEFWIELKKRTERYTPLGFRKYTPLSLERDYNSSTNLLMYCGIVLELDKTKHCIIVPEGSLSEAIYD